MPVPRTVAIAFLCAAAAIPSSMLTVASAAPPPTSVSRLTIAELKRQRASQSKTSTLRQPVKLSDQSFAVADIGLLDSDQAYAVSPENVDIAWTPRPDVHEYIVLRVLPLTASFRGQELGRLASNLTHDLSKAYQHEKHRLG